MAKRTRKTGSGRNSRRGSRSNKNTTSHKTARSVSIRSKSAPASLPIGPRHLPALRSTFFPTCRTFAIAFTKPHLRALHPAIYPRIAFTVRDQGQMRVAPAFLWRT